MSSEQRQFLIFIKYTREYLTQVTGYSRGHLSKIASGSRPPSEPFVSLCAQKLGEPAEELFKLIELPEVSRVPAPPRSLYQDLIETIDELGSRLTKAEAKIKELQDELKQYG